VHLADIDYMAIHQQSLFHQAHPLIKSIFSFFIIGIFIFSSDLEKNLGLLILLFFMSIGARLSFALLFHLLLYPLFFGTLFSFLMGGLWTQKGLLLLLRAVGVAWSFIFLLMTTPYTDVFRVFSFFMPSILVDIFLLTYRSIFVLLDSIENMFQVVRLRGGYDPWKIIKNAKNLSKMLGVIFLHAIEMSERMYQIYELRGYEGKLPKTQKITQVVTKGDIVLISIMFLYGIRVVIF